MELMLLFCDGNVLASDSSTKALAKAEVPGGQLRTTVAAFLPAPGPVQASFAGHPEQLPKLDMPCAQDLV